MTLGIEESASYMIPSPDKQQIKGAAIKLTPEERADLIHYFSADPFFVVKMRRNPTYKFAAGPSLKLADKSCQVLHANIDGLDVDWTIDLESGRLLRAEAGGEASEFSDWQQVGGVAVPFKVRTTKNGAFVSETKLSKYEVNPEIDAYTAFRVPDLWLTRWQVPPRRGYFGTQHGHGFPHRPHHRPSPAHTRVFPSKPPVRRLDCAGKVVVARIRPAAWSGGCLVGASLI